MGGPDPADPTAYLLGLEPIGIKFGLDNMRTLMDGLDHPERAFRSVHVAGTNGKGSVTAMVDAVLRAAGHRSARYTSPHLVDLKERFVIDGHSAAADVFAGVVTDLRTLVEALRAAGRLQAQPTFFEVTTAVAFELFRRAGVEVGVIEVGLGGRLDATNVVSPIATAITSIGSDHEQYLGTSIGDIATEKAGIIKPDVPVVVGDVPPEAMMVIERIGRERGAGVIRASEGVTIKRARDRLSDQVPAAPTIRLRTPARDYGELALPLRGDHQIANAVVAVRLLEFLDAEGISVPAEAIRDGIARTSWPGRLDHRTLPDGREAVLDAAHNPDGASALAAYLRGLPGANLPLVFAAMRDKDAREMFRRLLPEVAALVVTRASNPRSADPAVLAEQARAIAPHLVVRVEPSLADALDAAWNLSPRIVVAGSIFLVGDVVQELESRNRVIW